MNAHTIPAPSYGASRALLLSHLELQNELQTLLWRFGHTISRDSPALLELTQQALRRAEQARRAEYGLPPLDTPRPDLPPPLDAPRAERMTAEGGGL